ncbi:unnamed protein product [Penicillium salamii]|nr:unnamed protein product [Penicillium salamii]
MPTPSGPTTPAHPSYGPNGLSPAPRRRSAFQPRDHLESLITKHGYPTPVSLSSLRDLTATSSTYTPPSPGPIPDLDFDPLTLSSPTRPIPIPRRPTYEDLPVTPLTGRFNHTYFDDWERASQSAKSHSTPVHRRQSRHLRMRSDTSPYCSPVASPIMSPRRSNSPQPSRRSQPQSKSKPTQGFHLGSLPRFHPAVYQPNTTSHSTGSQPPSPRQSRQSSYRTSGSRDMMWQYRELMEASHSGPQAPRLDPLVSPGPVTPLALEAGDYLSHGSVSNTSDRVRDVPKQHAPEMVEKLKAYEEKARQFRKNAKR